MTSSATANMANKKATKQRYTAAQCPPSHRSTKPHACVQNANRAATSSGTPSQSRKKTADERASKQARTSRATTERIDSTAQRPNFNKKAELTWTSVGEAAVVYGARPLVPPRCEERGRLAVPEGGEEWADLGSLLTPTGRRLARAQDGPTLSLRALSSIEGSAPRPRWHTGYVGRSRGTPPPQRCSLGETPRARGEASDARRGIVFSVIVMRVLVSGTPKVGGTSYTPLTPESGGRPAFERFDSPLARPASSWFEYGKYRPPEGLVIWEAQFGDFLKTARSGSLSESVHSLRRRQVEPLSGLTLFAHGLRMAKARA